MSAMSAYRANRNRLQIAESSVPRWVVTKAPLSAIHGRPVSEQGTTAARPENAAGHGLTPGLVRLMAVTCAVTVANLYYAQPLLHSIGDSLHVGQGSASLLVTIGQLGYAAGLLLIVPAGDIMRRRPLLTGLLACCAVTLAIGALAPSLPLLDAAIALCCVTSVVVQM